MKYYRVDFKYYIYQIIKMTNKIHKVVIFTSFFNLFNYKYLFLINLSIDKYFILYLKLMPLFLLHQIL